MKFGIRRTSQFKRDMKRVLKRGKNIEKLMDAVAILAEGRALPSQYRDHPLAGEYKNKRDCHIEPDWILIYTIEDYELILYRTGNHTDLFG